MAGQSDSGNPDDIKNHLELIRAADDALKDAPPNETPEEKLIRESVRLPPQLRAEVDNMIDIFEKQVPGLTKAETDKLLTTREGRDALAAGEKALARVDNHLRSVTRERNPVIGKNYGVFGANPTTFAGVMRALELSVNENARIRALPEDAPERRLLFSPFVEQEVTAARDALLQVINARIGTRAALSRAVHIKRETLSAAQSIISAVREHLYANFPGGKTDPRLRDYGYRPLVRRGARGKSEQDQPETDSEG